MNARPTRGCVGPGFLRMIKSLLSECLKVQATSLLGPLCIDRQDTESDQPRFTVQCRLLRASLRALQCRVYMGLLSNSQVAYTGVLRPSGSASPGTLKIIRAASLVLSGDGMAISISRFIVTPKNTGMLFPPKVQP